MTPEVDAYIAWSVNSPVEMPALRPGLLGRGLIEAIKRGKPWYTYEGRNIVILQEMRAFPCFMAFNRTAQ